MIDIIPNWHPILVHFTIGLLATAVIFYLLAILMPDHSTLKTNWFIVARWSLWTGMGITLLTLIAGYLAYNSVAHDTPSHAAMTEHRNWAFATAAAFAVLTLWSLWIHSKKRTPGLVFLTVALLSGGLLATTGWHGGEAVYRYGLGVMSLPQTSGEGHAHQHADGKGHGSTAATPEMVTPASGGHGNHNDATSTPQKNTQTQSATNNSQTKQQQNMTETSHGATPHAHGTPAEKPPQETNASQSSSHSEGEKHHDGDQPHTH